MGSGSEKKIRFSSECLGVACSTLSKAFVKSSAFFTTRFFNSRSLLFSLSIVLFWRVVLDRLYCVRKPRMGRGEDNELFCLEFQENFFMTLH